MKLVLIAKLILSVIPTYGRPANENPFSEPLKVQLEIRSEDSLIQLNYWDKSNCFNIVWE